MAKKIDINDVYYKTFLPCMDGVLLKRDKGEEKTESGIFYAREVNKQTATVIAVGEDVLMVWVITHNVHVQCLSVTTNWVIHDHRHSY